MDVAAQRIEESSSAVQGIPESGRDLYHLHKLWQRRYCHQEFEFSTASVSSLKVLFVPWATKGLWAPIIEVWGGRNRWLFIALLALGISAYTGSHIALENVFGIGCMLFFLNAFSAVQDVAVDGIAIQMLPEEQLGLGNSIQVVMYKVGWFVGGAGFTYLMSILDWSMTLVVLALTYLLTAIMVTIVSAKDDESSEEETKETKNNGKDNDERHKELNHNDSQVNEILAILKDVVSTPGTLWLSIYVLLYKMGERGAINNMPLFLLDRGMTKNQLALWNGTLSQGLSILGSLHGGIVASKPLKIRDKLFSFSLYRFFSILLQFVLILMWNFNFFNEKDSLFTVYAVGVLSICSLSYSSGVISTVSFTLMMQTSRLCEKKTQASHYSLLASIEVAGKVLFAVIAGFIIDYAGIASSFAIFTVLAIFPIYILQHIPVDLAHIKTE
ncbi:major facilitator superfamily domain-containing protein 3-like isoform X1 [Macrobrachium nipponense]|uniref:major facilitator superfamily domain-containing protein 3-like isoform X1 n=1 Tax=Macrobrachium nipponense TaxID=159736 RepID=UPI0030C87CC9